MGELLPTCGPAFQPLSTRDGHPVPMRQATSKETTMECDVCGHTGDDVTSETEDGTEVVNLCTACADREEE